MQNAAAGGYSVLTKRRDDNYSSVVADLTSLIGHVQASIALVETAIAKELSEEFSEPEPGSGRRYLRAG
jgi:hypothetical protein